MKYPSSDMNRIVRMEEHVARTPESYFPEGKPTREALLAKEAKLLDAFLQKSQSGGISETEALAQWDILHVSQAHARGPEAFVEARNRWVRAVDDPKVLSAETINAWPQVREVAFDYGIRPVAYDPDEFTKGRDGWVEAGVVTTAEANSYVKPYVIKLLAVDKHFGEIQKERKGEDTRLKKFEETRRKYIQLGVLTEEDQIERE